MMGDQDGTCSSAQSVASSSRRFSRKRAIADTDSDSSDDSTLPRPLYHPNQASPAKRVRTVNGIQHPSLHPIITTSINQHGIYFKNKIYQLFISNLSVLFLFFFSFFFFFSILIFFKHLSFF